MSGQPALHESEMVSKAALKQVRQAGDDWEWAERLKNQLRELRHERTPFFLKLAELDLILKYKLRGQRGRTEKKRKPLTDDMVGTVTQAAFKVQSTNRIVKLRVRIGLLSSLPGIGVPIASAILALVEPGEYGIIDALAWEHTFGTPKKSLSDTDYARFMKEVWRLADELGWEPQRVEWCIWQLKPSTPPSKPATLRYT